MKEQSNGMQRYLLYLKLFCRTWYLVIPCLLVFVLYIAFVLNRVAVGLTPFQVAYLMERAGMIPVILFLFLSFEFFSQTAAAGLREINGTNIGGLIKSTASHAGCLFSIIVAFFGVAFLINGIYAWMWGSDPQFYNNYIQSFLLFLVLPAIICLILSLLASFLLNRLSAYAVLTSMAFLISPYSDFLNLARAPSGMSIIINNVIQFLVKPFRILLPNSEYAPFSLYGLPQEIFRWELITAWLGILSILLILVVLRPRVARRIRLCLIPLALYSLACLVYSYQPASFLDMGKHWDGYRYDLNADSADSNDPVGINMLVNSESTDLRIVRVKAYDLTISLDRQLTVEAQLSLDQSQPVKMIVLTLYRGYRLASVIDDKNLSLRFTQEDDRVVIALENDAFPESVTLSYTGKNPFFIANRQSAMLPGFFAWYPIAGDHSIISDSEDSYNTAIHIPEADFSLTVQNGPQGLISNIQQTAHRKFSGKSTSLTLIGGFISQLPTNDKQHILNDLIYQDPIDLVQANSRLEDLVACLIRRYGEDRAQKLLSLPIIQSSKYLHFSALTPRLIMMPDHLLVADIRQLSTLDILGLFIPGNQKKLALYSCLNFLDRGLETVQRQITIQESFKKDFQLTAAAGEGSKGTSDIIDHYDEKIYVLELLAKAITQYGYDAVCHQVYQYLQSGAGTTETELDWLRSYVETLHGDTK